MVYQYGPTHMRYGAYMYMYSVNTTTLCALYVVNYVKVKMQMFITIATVVL